MQTEEQRMETRQMRELRKQNSKLKKENSQLRKQLNRLENNLFDTEEDEADQDNGSKVLPLMASSEKQMACPACGVYNVHSFILSGRSFINCGCGHKGWSQNTITAP